MRAAVKIAGAALLAITASGCPPRKVPPSVTVPANTAEPDVSTGELRRELEASVLETLGQLTLGNIETYADGLRRDKPVTLLGAEDGATFVGDGRDAVGLVRWPLLDSQPEFVSKNLDLHVSPRGEVGWSYDEISLRVYVDGRLASLPLRLTLVFTRDVDRWVVASDHWSFPLSIGEITRATRSGAAASPTKLEPRRDSPDADALVALIGRLINGDQRARGQAVSRESESLVVLPGIDGEYRGARIDSSPTLVDMFEGAQTVGLRDYRVESSASGEVAWMTANLVVRGASAEDAAIKLRATYVFEHSATGWQVVHTHISAPVARGFYAGLLDLK